MAGESLRESMLRESEDRWRQMLATYGTPERRRLTPLETANRILLANVAIGVLCAALLIVLVLGR